MTVRTGYALAYAVLLALCLSILAAGMLALTARESAIARTHLRLLQARAAAEAAARETVAAWSTDRYVDLAPGDARSETVDGAAVTITRIGAEQFIIAAEAGPPDVDRSGTAAGAPPLARAAMLVHVLSPDPLLAAFPAALAADSAARVVSGTITAPGECDGRSPDLPAIVAPDVVAGTATIEGVPPILSMAPPPLPAALAGPTIARLADLRASGTVTPAPRSDDGRCVATEGNWGDPRPLRACHTLLPIVHAPGDLVVAGGEGRGLLVVDGDLRLEDGFTFHGLILVRGRLSAGHGTAIRGAVRARSADVDGASITLDDCAIRQVLAAPALQRPLRPRQRWWVPAF